jgi:putative DNA primase/helicase
MMAGAGDVNGFVQAMGPVARMILGEPSQVIRAKNEIRYGARGSLSISLDKGTWFDNEIGEGGGVIDFVILHKRLNRLDAISWLKTNGHLAEEPQGHARTIAAIYDYLSASGELSFQVVRFVPKTFRQRAPDGNGGYKWKMAGVQLVIYRLPEVIEAVSRDETIYIVEGEKAVHALESIGVVATCSPGGAGKWRTDYGTPLAGAHVVILPDNDPQAVTPDGELKWHADGRPVLPGQDHAADVARKLKKIAASIRIVSLPDLPSKGDAADWVAGGGTLEQLKALSPRSADPEPSSVKSDHPVRPSVEDPSRPTVTVLNGLRHRAADEGLAAMTHAKIPFYQRGRTMVRAALSRAKTSDGQVIDIPGIVDVTVPMLGRALGRAAEWQKVKADGEPVRIDPPKEIVEQIASMFGEWPFPPLTGVIGTPTMRPDGSILDTVGYDEATGLVLIAPPPMPPIPPRPTRLDANVARETLLDLLSEFPFADEASRSVALSMILTAVLRGALLPAVPMHVATAPQPGTGKSYLGDIASAIAIGERCAVIAMAPNAEETEKRLIGAALSGQPIIAVDNVSEMMSGDFLMQVTERPLLQVRPLGTSRPITISNTFTVFATGNNLSAPADLVRRTILCRLDANLENPEDRTFRSNPVKTVLADRGKYIAACLTIGRAYIVAERPGMLRSLPSFEPWSDLVRSAIVWLGMTDPCESMEMARAEDPIRAARAAVFSAWSSELGLNPSGLTTHELILEAESLDDHGFLHPTFREACLSVAAERSGSTISGRRLGNYLAKADKNRVGDLKLTVNRQDPTRPRWVLLKV